MAPNGDFQPFPEENNGKHMSRSSGGACRPLKKNSLLAQSISDASWGELVRQLDYKCRWYGRVLVKVDRWFPSSKCCGSCGHTVRAGEDVKRI